jgi:hypothetical protein
VGKALFHQLGFTGKEFELISWMTGGGVLNMLNLTKHTTDLF